MPLINLFWRQGLTVQPRLDWNSIEAGLKLKLMVLLCLSKCWDYWYVLLRFIIKSFLLSFLLRKFIFKLLIVHFPNLCLFVCDRVSLCNPSCPRTHSVDKTDLELRSASLCLPIAGIKVLIFVRMAFFLCM